MRFSGLSTLYSCFYDGMPLPVHNNFLEKVTKQKKIITISWIGAGWRMTGVQVKASSGLQTRLSVSITSCIMWPVCVLCGSAGERSLTSSLDLLAHAEPFGIYTHTHKVDRHRHTGKKKSLFVSKRFSMPIEFLRSLEVTAKSGKTAAILSPRSLT